MADEPRLRIEIGREADGRFTADIVDLPGMLAYGATAAEATAQVEAFALRVLVERLEDGGVISGAEGRVHVAELTSPKDATGNQGQRAPDGSNSVMCPCDSRTGAIQ